MTKFSKITIVAMTVMVSTLMACANKSGNGGGNSNTAVAPWVYGQGCLTNGVNGFCGDTIQQRGYIGKAEWAGWLPVTNPDAYRQFAVENRLCSPQECSRLTGRMLVVIDTIYAFLPARVRFTIFTEVASGGGRLLQKYAMGAFSPGNSGLQLVYFPFATGAGYNGGTYADQSGANMPGQYDNQDGSGSQYDNQSGGSNIPGQYSGGQYNGAGQNNTYNGGQYNNQSGQYNNGQYPVQPGYGVGAGVVQPQQVALQIVTQFCDSTCQQMNGQVYYRGILLASGGPMLVNYDFHYYNRTVIKTSGPTYSTSKGSSVLDLNVDRGTFSGSVTLGF